MILALLLVVAPLVQGDAERARAGLDAGRYGDAWAESAALADALLRDRLQSAILFRAGDHAGALELAEQGLERSPSDPELLQRAAAAAVWLGDASAAQGFVRRLERAIPELGLELESRSAWDREARDLAHWTEQLRAHDAARRGALRRGRIASIAVLAGTLGVLVWFGSRTLALRA